MFERLQWNVAGFVAPAWLLGDGARAALARTPLRYTSTHAHLESLADGAPHRSARDLGVGAQRVAALDAAGSGSRIARIALRDAPLVRVALHPADVGDARILDAWRVC